jgi:hypothetical protein
MEVDSHSSCQCMSVITGLGEYTVADLGRIWAIFRVIRPKLKFGIDEGGQSANGGYGRLNWLTPEVSLGGLRGGCTKIVSGASSEIVIEDA